MRTIAISSANAMTNKADFALSLIGSPPPSGDLLETGRLLLQRPRPQQPGNTPRMERGGVYARKVYEREKPIYQFLSHFSIHFRKNT